MTMDHEGDENVNLYPQSDPAAGQVVIYDVPRSHPDIINIGPNDRDKA
jgi:hypothetical protein